MDIATLFAALSLCGLIQGVLLLMRWNRASRSEDLLWTGCGCLLVGIGAGLYGARYFGMPAVFSIIIANAIILLGVAVLAQGPRGADGMTPNWIMVAGPPLIWLGACTQEGFLTNPDARLHLYSLLSGASAALAALHLARGGLALTGRKYLLFLWSSVAITMVGRMLATEGVTLGLVDRYAASIWHVSYLILCSAALMGIGYVNLALSDDLQTITPLASGLVGELADRSSRGQGSGRPDVAGETGLLWTLRFDRGLMAKHTMQRQRHADIADLAQIITGICKQVHGAQRAGVDRILWRSVASAGELPTLQSKLKDALASYIARPSFPIGAMTCGVAIYEEGDILVAAAAADRHAVLIRAT